MAGSTLGTLFKITTWGESHGPALVSASSSTGVRRDFLSVKQISRSFSTGASPVSPDMRPRARRMTP